MANFCDRLLRTKSFQVQLNLMAWTAFAAHNIAFVFTPLNKQLMKSKSESTRYDLKDALPISIFKTKNEASNSFHGPQPDTCLQFVEDHNIDREDSESWYSYLSKPLELVQVVKRYHSGGNLCIISMLIQIVLLLYLITKCLFHQIYTGHNQEAADYYDQHYFPRMYHSVPSSHDMYGLLTFECIYILIVRLLLIVRLINRSIINRNRYKEIEMSQLNGTFMTSMKWPLRDWIRVFYLGRQHKKNCRIRELNKQSVDDVEDKPEGANEKRGHLNCKPLDKSLCTGRSKFLCYANPIDFSKCYEDYGLILNNNHHPDWYYPRCNCRIDLYEFGWLVLMLSIGWISTIGVTLLAITNSIIIESTVMSPNGFQTTPEALKQVPDLLSSPNHLIRLLDDIALIALSLPHQIEAAVLFLNVTALLSRIRKLNERLQEDLNLCIHLMEIDKPSRSDESRASDIDLDGILKQVFIDHTEQDSLSTAQKDSLNKSLESSMLIAKTINDEFRMLSKSQTIYLDILLILGGFCVAMQVSFLFSTGSAPAKFVVLLSIIPTAVPVLTSSVLCMAVESRVGITSV